MKFLMTLLSTFWIAMMGTLAAQAETDKPAVTEMILGDVNAPIEIIEYASMTCPHCANFHSDVYPQLKEYYIETGKVKFVFREVYFDKYGMWASMIARCAGPDRFFGIIDQMFEKQKTWSRAGNDLAIVTELSKIGKLEALAMIKSTPVCRTRIICATWWGGIKLIWKSIKSAAHLVL